MSFVIVYTDGPTQHLIVIAVVYNEDCCHSGRRPLHGTLYLLLHRYD